jgi:uncharacterized protein (DUF2147 family)
MTKILPRFAVSASLAAAAFASPASAGASSAWTGVWRNTNNTVHIKAAPCGAKMCATVIWADAQAKAAVAAQGRNIIGMQLLRDFQKTGPREWKGTAYVPDRDLTVSGTIRINDHNTLEATGCALSGMVCQTRQWSRIS